MWLRRGWSVTLSASASGQPAWTELPAAEVAPAVPHGPHALAPPLGEQRLREVRTERLGAAQPRAEQTTGRMALGHDEAVAQRVVDRVR